MIELIEKRDNSIVRMSSFSKSIEEYKAEPLLCLLLQRPWYTCCRRSVVPRIRSAAFTHDCRRRHEFQLRIGNL